MLSCNVNKVRSATLKGRKYLVANVTLIVPGVLNGSKGALFYPRDEVSHPNNVDAWNGMPLVNGHPTENGAHVSARSPGIQERFGLGHVYNAKINPKTGSLRAQAWFDVESMERVEPRLLAALKAGRPVEVSTGLFTHDEPAPMGSVYNGREYQYIARKYRPDHLAILIDQEGACSLRDGCGVMVENAKGGNGKWVTTDAGNHIFIEGGTAKTGPGGKSLEGGDKGSKGKKDEPKKPSNRTSTGDDTPDPTEDELKKRVDSKGRKIYRGSEKTRDAFEKSRAEYRQATKEGRVFDRDKAKQRAEAHRDTLLGKTGASDYPQMTGSAPASGTSKPESTGFKSKHDGAEYANESDRDSDDRHFDKKKAAATKAKASEDAIRAKLEKVKSRGPKSSAKVERLKGKLESIDARIDQLKGDLKGSKERSAALESKLTPAKTISDDDWDKNVAGLEQARSKYRQARKSGDRISSDAWLRQARGFRKTLIGNAATIQRRAQLIVLNCGGPGSGVPGPCPENKPDSPTSRKVAPTLDLSKVKPSQPLNRETPEYLDARDKADRASYLAKMAEPVSGDTAKLGNEAQVASKLASRGGKRLPGRTDGGRHSSLHKKAASAHQKAATAHKEASSKLAIAKPDAALKHAKAAEAHSAASTAHTKAGHELMIVGNKMLLNCGGEGSGKPGPCPSGGSEFDRPGISGTKSDRSDFARKKAERGLKIAKQKLAQAKKSGNTKEIVKLMNEIQSHSQTIKRVDMTSNTRGGRTMTLTKPEAVEFLTANCDCWKAKGATKTLNALPEDTLNTLVASEQLATAVRNRLGEKAATLTVNQLAESLADPELELELIDEDLTENCDMGGGEMEEEDAEMEGTEAEEATPPAFKKKGKKKMPPVPPPTGNSGPRRMTMEEWNAVAPLEVIERDTRAKQVVNGERDRIVSKLVANSAARTKEAKDQLRRALNAKSLDDLNLMAMLQVNRKAAVGEAERAVNVPNYGGLAHSYEEPVYNEGVNEDGSINDEEGMLVHNTAKVKWADEVKLYAPVKKAM